VFFPNSRYADAGTYEIELPSGSTVIATRLPPPNAGRIRGFHRRLEGQRLDLLANFYLKDATAFWRLCDANGTISPDALAARELVGIPAKER
jgi:hypothetical protein